MKEEKKTVFYDTKLIEIVPFSANLKYNESSLISFLNLKCTSCSNFSDKSKCSLDLFDLEKFLKMIKTSRDQNKQNAIIASQKMDSPHKNAFQSTQNYSFFTQNDAPYFQTNNSQNTNSILEAIQLSGYFEYVTFIATVQRAGLIKWFSNTTQASFSGLTQRTKTQSSQ
jgi:uncharacterized protein YbcV (DUF1398 family)